MMQSEMWSAAQHSEDRLKLGLQLAAGMQDPRTQTGFLGTVLAGAGVRCDVAAARQVARLAEQLHARAPEQAARFLDALSSGSTSAASGWMRAALLEAAGRFAEAAEAFDLVPDGGDAEGRALRLQSRARTLARSGAWSDAVPALREAAKSTTSYRMLSAIDRLLTQIRKSGEVPFKRRCKVALVGSTTLEFLVPAFRAACFGSHIDVEIYVGPFGQYRQEILDPGSALAAFGPDVVIIATDWRAAGLGDETAAPAAAVAETVSTLRGLWHQCRDRIGALVIQHNFEVPPVDPYGRLSAGLEGGRARLLRQINLALWEAASQEAGVAILDVERVSAGYGQAGWSSAALWYSARQYPAPDAVPHLVRHQAALLRALLGLGKKVLVLDLDGVLWGGVIGEDDLSGIQLGGAGVGEAYVDFQRYVRALGQRGILLAVCSKNNEKDAMLPFQSHPEMVLALDDISVFVANWSPKDVNLRSIAETLKLGLDSLVFVDDSPTERAWIRRQLPEVDVPELPDDPALFMRALDEQLYFEAVSLTAEDRQRVAAYRGNVQRRALEAASTSLEEFLAELRMQIELTEFDEADLPRIVQLINKTNQFNLTNRRLSDTQTRALLGRGDYYTQCMRVRDRFGDNGLTGVLIAVDEGRGLHIDNWVMSCRVLGRRLEEVMVGALLAYARHHGREYVSGEYVPTARNKQVEGLFGRLGFDRVDHDPDGRSRFRWTLSAKSFEWPGWFDVIDRTQRMVGAGRT